MTTLRRPYLCAFLIDELGHAEWLYLDIHAKHGLLPIGHPIAEIMR